MAKYIQQRIETLRNSNPAKFFQQIKTSSRPGDETENMFSILSQVDRGMSNYKSVEEISQYFSKISQEYKPMNTDDLPRVSQRLRNMEN